MPVLELDGRVLEVDGDGFLANPEIWDATVAESIAQYDGIEKLTDKHWSVINIIRTNYEEKGMAPMIRTICKETGLRLREIYELFPLGPARGACRVAGLPKPDGCV
jgi:tRNA 2-thiouridine synthesizing protein E